MTIIRCTGDGRATRALVALGELAVGDRRSLAAIAAGVILAWSADAAPAKDLSIALANMYSALSLSPPTADQMTVCYGFGCARRWRLDFTAADRRRLADLLAAGRSSAAAERKAAGQAVVWFDRRVGPIIGTNKRVADADIR